MADQDWEECVGGRGKKRQFKKTNMFDQALHQAQTWYPKLHNMFAGIEEAPEPPESRRQELLKQMREDRIRTSGKANEEGIAHAAEVERAAKERQEQRRKEMEADTEEWIEWVRKRNKEAKV